MPVKVNGLTFKNPVGLGAGFDKNAVYLRELEMLGFGFIEIGTVTPQAQQGNPAPRLFRLPKDKALLNRMGFNNDGADVIAGRLESWRHKSSDVIIGGNIGKNKSTTNADAWKDYLLCFQKLHKWVDYFVVNVSSPNTPGLRELQERYVLQNILTKLQEENNLYEVPRPIFLKLAPDLEYAQIDEIISMVLEIKLDGLIIANTTISRDGLITSAEITGNMGAGGISGRPLAIRSTELIKYIHQKTGGKITLVGSGGIFTGQDAGKKLAAGAALVQVWTGFIYEGPQIVKNIIKELNQ